MSENQNQIVRPNIWMRVITMSSIALMVAMFFAFLIGIFMNQSQDVDHAHSSPSAQPVHISAAELEEQYGMQVTLIGVTAGGGMVDFRFKVLDADKARLLLDHHDNMPQLIPTGSEIRLGIPGMHSPNYVSGKVYYMLYGNAGGIVKPGLPVEVAFGNMILDAVEAR